MEAQLRIERVPLDSIRPDPANVRLHGERNLEAIQGSLARFGQQKPIVVDRAGVIRAGNGTFHAAKSLGWTELDVIHTDLEGVEATAYAIADNRSSELAEWDNAALAKLLEELRTEDALSGVGFEDGEIDELLDGLIDESLDLEEAPVPEPPENPTTRKGDLWILGRHRLLCGDSASVEDVDRLLAGSPIHLVNTDPPYNVRVEPRSNNAIAAGLARSPRPTTRASTSLGIPPKPSRPGRCAPRTARSRTTSCPTTTVLRRIEQNRHGAARGTDRGDSDRPRSGAQAGQARA